MRITFVLPFAALSGGARVIATYARMLSKQGHTVHVVSQARSKQGRLKDLWRYMTGRRHQIKRKNPSPLFDFLGPRHVLYDPDRPFEPDLVPDGDAVFATWWRTAASVAALPASKGEKFYMLQDYEVYDYQPDGAVAASYRLPMHKIAVSSYIRDEISKRHGVDDIEVINNAVDMAQFSGPKRAKSDALTVGFLYNRHARKRVEMAVAAVELARNRLPDLKVIVFGKMPREATSLPDWVSYHHAPDQADIPDLYRSCDLWLFPSEKEGFGLPLLEAMACRTPVVATPAGAAPDLIDGTNGVLLPDDADAEAFCHQILAFARMTDDIWQKFSDAAYRTAGHHDWAHAAQRLVGAIEKAIETRERATP